MAITVIVELAVQVVAKVKGTSVTNWWWWKNVPEWWVVLGDKWQVAMKLAVELASGG